MRVCHSELIRAWTPIQGSMIREIPAVTGGFIGDSMGMLNPQSQSVASNQLDTLVLGDIWSRSTKKNN